MRPMSIAATAAMASRSACGVLVMDGWAVMSCEVVIAGPAS